MIRTGYPPARSALRFRLALALFGLVVCGSAAGALFAGNVLQGWAIVLAILAAIAVVDAVVVGVRLAAERRQRTRDRERPDHTGSPPRR